MRALVICAVLAVVPPVARAAGPETEADALIARGLELRRQEKRIDALDLFQRAHAIAPSSRTLGQIGLVEASLQHWAAAEDHVTAALATPSDPWVRKNRGFLAQALTTAKGHVGEIEIIGPAGTAISIDGKPAGSLPAIPVIRRAEGTGCRVGHRRGLQRLHEDCFHRRRCADVAGHRPRSRRRAPGDCCRAAGACGVTATCACLQTLSRGRGRHGPAAPSQRPEPACSRGGSCGSPPTAATRAAR